MSESVVVFDIEKFRATFPEFSNVTDAQLEFLFDEAADFLDNTARSLIQDVARRERLLYLLMAHIAYLRYGSVGADGAISGGSGTVGRVSSASEGSVSASFDIGGVGSGFGWYTQTPYGFAFWQATKVYRMANYYPGHCYGRQNYRLP